MLQVETSHGIAGMIRQVNTTKHQFNRSRIHQWIAPFLAGLYLNFPQPMDNLPDFLIGADEDTDRNIGRSPVQVGNVRDTTIEQG
jgi:hypothetical protein